MAEVAAAQTYQTATDGQQPQYAETTGGVEDAMEVGLLLVSLLVRRRARTLAGIIGHGLTYDNVQPIAAIPQLAELNIGHYLIGEAIFCGLEPAVLRMRELMDAAR